MTEIKTYVPATLPYSDLIRYGENHDDAWVRKMASIIDEIHTAIRNTNYTKVATVEDLLDAYETELREYSSSLDYAEEELEEEQARRMTAEDRYNAVLYDLDKDAQVAVIRSLKAEVLAKKEDIRQLNTRALEMQRTIDDTNRRLRETEEKLNMWTIMNKV